MFPMISVIVSVYNESKYIGRCIESVMHQSYTNLEILLIDDGSTDQSGIICDEYAKKDHRIRVIHKQNGGISAVRNLGIESACGQYIGFVDGDDYIESDMYEVLYRLLIEHQADIAVCNVSNCYETGAKNLYSGGEIFTCSGEEALEITLEGKKMPASLCNKLYRREVIGDLRFRVGKTYEDAFFLPELFLRASLLVVTTDAYYNYWHRVGSITTSGFSERTLDVIDAYQFTYDLVKISCPRLLPVAEFRLYRSYTCRSLFLFYHLHELIGTQPLQAVCYLSYPF